MNNSKANLYIVTDENERFVKEFDSSQNILPIKEWIENWLNENNIEYEQLVFYVNRNAENEIIIQYGGLMYFVIKRVQ